MVPRARKPAISDRPRGSHGPASVLTLPACPRLQKCFLDWPLLDLRVFAKRPPKRCRPGTFTLALPFAKQASVFRNHSISGVRRLACFPAGERNRPSPSVLTMPTLFTGPSLRPTGRTPLVPPFPCSSLGPFLHAVPAPKDKLRLLLPFPDPQFCAPTTLISGPAPPVLGLLLKFKLLQAPHGP